ncbi:hypothetical protein ABZS53_14895 [Streptomyces sp. NPDC005499]|uniref:hypothetical protein n=1 Tax=Streptomyces sp. NPDC005499 TaxID=3154883 RepID=UPI0033AAD84E
MARYSIGIDQSYSGCAIVHYNAADHSAAEKVYDFSPKLAGSGLARLAHVYRTLREHFALIEQLGPITHVCYEGYAYGAKFKREEMGELGGILKLALATQFPAHVARRIHAVAPPTVKKFVTGSGRADKDKMLLAVYKRWEHEASSHDAADAYVLARIAADLDAETLPELKFQQEVLDTVRGTKKSSPTGTS